MNILALDTSMGACSAAVLRSDGAKPKLFARQKLMARGHAEALMPMVAETMAEAALPFAKLDLIATTSIKRDETGIVEAARARGVRLAFVDQADLELAAARGATWSERVLALAGVPSVAEAAALAAAGPKARLILTRIVVGPATCALASDEGAS